MVEADGKCLSLNEHSGDGAVWAPMDMMEVEDKLSGLIWGNEDGKQAFALK